MRYPTRRHILLGALTLPALAGCTAPLSPLPAGTDPGAEALLAQSAAAHGLAALGGIHDVAVSYTGEWRPLVGTLQPALVDAGFRGGSQERLLLRDRLTGQAHTGPKGRKQVARRSAPGGEGVVRVWFNGVEASDRERRDAAALVADGYALFLLGPMLLADRGLAVRHTGVERIVVEGQEHECDVLRLRLAPGLGFSAADQVALFIARTDRLMRRVRFTLDGLESTRGAVAEVDTGRHVALHGVQWPTRFHERLLRPLPLPVHDWQLTGLDVDRGLDPAEIDGAAFTGRALAPAAPLPG